MIAFAGRALPWKALTGAGLVVVVVLAALSLQVARLWPLEGCAVGLLAAAVAWCFDEPSAAIVDVAPRTLAWRTVMRTTGVAWLTAWWLVAVALTHASLNGHALAIAWHGGAAALTVAAVCTARRAAGAAAPGMTTAAVVTPVAMFLALGRPYPRAVPLFPYVYGGPWGAAAVWWGGAAALAALLVVGALVDLRGRCAAAGQRARSARSSPMSTMSS